MGYECIRIMIDDVVFKQLEPGKAVPYDLLLLADPSRELVEGYLSHSEVYLALMDEVVVGVAVLAQIDEGVVEIKNLAVDPVWQGKGIGQRLLQEVIGVARRELCKSICIGTADSSIGQLYLYQKMGFELLEIRHNFFANQYTDPIFENGIQAKHMLVLSMQL